jgi:hypothetical protein
MRQEVAVQILPRPRIQSVRDRRKPNRLDEAN